MAVGLRSCRKSLCAAAVGCSAEIMRGWRCGSTAIVAGLLVAATVSCGQDRAEEVGVPATAGSATTAAPANSTPERATTTGPATPSTSITPSEFPYWSTECVDRIGAADASFEFDEQLSTFASLGAAPSLDLLLPVVETSVGAAGSSAGTVAIPGGLLVGVYPPSAWPTAEYLASSSLVAVDVDGTVRWRRCFDDVETRLFVVAPAELEPTTAWVITSAWDEPLQILGVDLVTGADVPFPSDVSEVDQRGVGQRFMVLGARREVTEIVAGDVLTIVDLLDGTTWEIPYPPTATGERADSEWFTVHDVSPVDNDFVLVHGYPSPGEVRSVYVDGSWTENPETYRDVLPLTVSETFGEPFELQLRDGAGDLVWVVSDFHGVGREGFHWAIADDVVIAMRCTEWNTEGYCSWSDDGLPVEELVGFDLETGQELWTLAGNRAIPIIDGNQAILTHDNNDDGVADDGYVLVDLLTGERVDNDSEFSRPWPVGAFAEECCGGDEFVHVGQAGAIVVATNADHVRVWYPAELTIETIPVDLMS
jgi:hypothetical protein